MQIRSIDLCLEEYYNAKQMLFVMSVQMEMFDV